MENNEKIFLGKSKLPIHFVIAGYAMVIIGLYSLIILDWGALLLIPALLITTVYDKKYLYPDQLLIKEQTILFGRKIMSSQQAIQKPEYIVLRPVQLSQSQHVLSLSRETHTVMCRVNLVNTDNKITSVYTGNYPKSLAIAKQCRDVFKVELKNRITSEKYSEV